jgi:peptidoglycan hydrolase-like protein with peptidoglycan-binding domain
MPRFLNKILIVVFFLAVCLPGFVFADNYGQKTTFYVDEEYDALGRESISATLRHIGIKAYFYIEDEWWEELTDEEKQEVSQSISNLAAEFDTKIYPALTITYGHEWKPGIDNDSRITILFHQMKEKAGGYNRSVDEYRKIQVPFSNEREMVYLNPLYLNSPIIKGYLAHEFTHLISFYQKEKLFGVEEEVWLNEARADYSPTLLGYDDEFQGSNLQSRVREFLNSPSDSLTEWQNTQKDYAVVNLFIQYLVDHYGKEILVDSLQSGKTGIESINYALKKNNFEKTFSEIFTDWALSLFLNDCSVKENYCYKNKNLSNLRITPALIFLPTTQQTNISLTYGIKDWSIKWFKIIGGNKGLEIEIKNLSPGKLVVPYVIKKDGTEISVETLKAINDFRKIALPDFAKENASLVLIPTIQYKLSGFGEDEPAYNFMINISTIEEEQEQDKEKPIDEMVIEELKAKILELQQKIAQLQALLAQLLEQQTSCQRIEKNLYYGLTNDSQVKCLQEFLKNQGPEIYPEGLVTGNFLGLTKAAVIRFQEKYKSEVLEPLGLTRGTGYVGPRTRQKINQLLKR